MNKQFYKPMILALAAIFAASPHANAQTVEAVENPDGQANSRLSALLARAEEYIEKRQWSQAIETYDKAIAIEPTNPTARGGRAYAYAWTNRIEQAEEDLALAEADGKLTALTHRVRAVLADRRSDDETLLDELSKSLALDPTDRWTRQMRASVWQDRGEFDKALADADALIEYRPNDPISYMTMASLLQKQEKPVLAEKVAIELLFIDPDNPYNLAAAGDIFLSVGNRDLARKQFDKAIELYPGESGFFQLRADARELDDLDGSIADMKRALELWPDNADYIADLALLEFRRGNFAQADSGFSRILAEEPNDYNLLAYRAMAQNKLGNEAAGKRLLEKAIAASGGPSDEASICSFLALEAIMLDDAMALCEKALAADPERPEILRGRGLVLLRMGQATAALADFDRAIAINDHVGSAFYERAIARWRLGNHSGALEDLARAKALMPNVDRHFRKYGLDDLPRQ